MSPISAQASDAVATTGTKASAGDGEHLLPAFTWGADDEYELQVGGEVRLRGEYRKNYDMESRERDDDDGFAFLRTTVNFDLTYRSLVRAFVEVMDAREIGARHEYGQESHADLHQAFLEFPLSPGAETLKDAIWRLRIGRQEMKLGRDKTFSDASSWSNLRRRYDGIRAMYRTEETDLDLFVLQPNYYDRRRGDDIITDRGVRRSEEYFYGAYLTSRRYAPHTWEAYFLGLSDRESHRTFSPNRRSEDGTYGSEHRYTIGSALYGPLYEDDRGELSYTVEGAYQFGRYSKDQIRAWFIRGDTTYEWKRPWSPSLGLVGTLASGDRDPDDGVANRFDHLFGSTHSPYGIMDFVRPNNMRELAVVGSIKPTDKLTLQAEAHAFWLDSKTDSWSAPSGSLRDKSGDTGRSIGQEISLEAEYEYSERLTIEAGAAHFFPGSHPRSFGQDDGANFFYLQTRFSF